MKKLLFLILILSLLSSFSTWGEENQTQTSNWSNPKISLQLSYSILQITDYIQTKEAMKRDYHEVNPILGKDPSPIYLDAYFITTFISHFLLSHFLPENWDIQFQITTIIIQAVVVGFNFYQLNK
jgi:hypothetical protein